MNDLYEAGLAVMRRLWGRKPNRTYVPEAFFDKTIERVYGELWNRPDLSLEERSMLTVALLAAQGKAVELDLHVLGAKNLGLPREKVEEIMNHVAYYCGWPTALHGFKAIDRAWAKPVR